MKIQQIIIGICIIKINLVEFCESSQQLKSEEWVNLASPTTKLWLEYGPNKEIKEFRKRVREREQTFISVKCMYSHVHIYIYHTHMYMYIYNIYIFHF